MKLRRILEKNTTINKCQEMFIVQNNKICKLVDNFLFLEFESTEIYWIEKTKGRVGKKDG